MIVLPTCVILQPKISAVDSQIWIREHPTLGLLAHLCHGAAQFQDVDSKILDWGASKFVSACPLLRSIPRSWINPRSGNPSQKWVAHLCDSVAPR